MASLRRPGIYFCGGSLLYFLQEHGGISGGDSACCLLAGFL